MEPGVPEPVSGLITYRVSYRLQGSSRRFRKGQGDAARAKEICPNSIRNKEVRIIAEREVTVDGYAGVFVHVEVGATR